MKRNRNKKNKKIILVVENILFQATRRRKKTSKESTFYYVPTFAVCIAKNDTLFDTFDTDTGFDLICSSCLQYKNMEYCKHEQS